MRIDGGSGRRTTTATSKPSGKKTAGDSKPKVDTFRTGSADSMERGLLGRVLRVSTQALRTAIAQKADQAARPAIAEKAVKVRDTLKVQGPRAALTELKAQTRATKNPEEAAALVRELEPELVQIGAHLRKTAQTAGTTRPQNQGSTPGGTRQTYVDGANIDAAQEELHAMLGDLGDIEAKTVSARRDNRAAALTVLASTAREAVEGSPVAARTAITRLVEQGVGTEVWTTAASQLREAGDEGGLREINRALVAGAEGVERSFTQAKEAADLKNQELGYLLNAYGPLLTDAQKNAAITDFMEQNESVYSAYDAASADLLAVHEALSSHSGATPSNDAEREALQEARASLRKCLPDALATDAGHAVLERALDEEATEGNSPLLEEVSAAVTGFGIASESAQFVGGTLVTCVASRAARLSAAGDLAGAQTALDALTRHRVALGVSTEDVESCTSVMKRLLDPTLDANARTALVREMGAATDEVSAFGKSTSLGRAFRGLGALAATAGAAVSVAGALDDPSFTNVSQAIVDSLGLGISAAELTNSFKPVFSSSALAGAGKLAGSLGIALQVVSLGQQLSEGKYAEAGITTVGIGGSLAALSSSAVVSGVGAVVVIGAAVAAWQYSRVAASNAHENDVTRRFLEKSGFDRETARELANHSGDTSGQGSPGPALEVLRERLSISPERFQAILNDAGPDKVAALVAAVHSVDGNGNGKASETASNDDAVTGGSGRGGDRRVRSWTALEAKYAQLGFPTA